MRSLLLVPGDDGALDEALLSGADALVVDLEASVPPAAREAARGLALAFLRRAGAASGRPRLWVRVNGLGTGLAEADLAAVMAGAPDGIVLPGAAGGRDVQNLAARLAVHEAERGLPDGGTRILAVADTARGALAAATLAGSSPRLAGIAWDGAALAADLGADPSAGPGRLARSLTLLAAAAAEVDAIDAAPPASLDPARLAQECSAASRDGFAAGMALHPAQVPAINAAFTPSPGALAEARAVVEAFAAAPGASAVYLDGRTIGRSGLRRAERLLARVTGIFITSGG